MSNSTVSNTRAGKEFVIERSFNAPRELVFSMYTDERHLARWWGPQGFTMQHCKADVRPGGTFHYCMTSPQGDEMWGRFEYREVQAPEKLVFTTSFSDPDGKVVRAPFSADFPLQVLSTLTFSETGGKTTIHMTGLPYEASENERDFFEKMFASMNQGYKGTLDQLEAYLATL